MSMRRSKVSLSDMRRRIRNQIVHTWTSNSWYSPFSAKWITTISKDKRTIIIDMELNDGSQNSPNG